MSLNPDWGNDESHTSLKTVLKWEIQHLLQRLAEVGEEAFLFTVCLKDGGTTEMGSPRGQGFLSMSDLQNVKSQFQSYCQGFSEICEQMEIYRDLSSGQLSLGPKSSIDSSHRRKRRKKTYLQQPKIPRLDVDQQVNFKQELSSTSDENSEGNIINFDPGMEQDRFESTADTDASVKLSLPMLSMRSRRKRTPKKVVTKNNIGGDDNDQSFLSETFYHTKDLCIDNQSENLESTGSLYEDFYVKKSHSMEQLCDYQSENLELTSHSEDFSINTLPYNQDVYSKGVDCDISLKPFQEPQNENNELSVLLRKTKETLSKTPKSSPRKSINMNSTASFETDIKPTFDSDQSMPVFPNFANLKKGSLYANSVGMANSVGGAEDICLPITLLGEDGHMRMTGKSEVGGNNPVLTNEKSMLLGNLSKSADNSPKIETQVSDSSPLHTPSRKKGFKPVPHDENPAETALLDASKLGVGRYKCPMCGQTTRDRHDLKRHLRTHTKEKPYKCSLCGKKFTRKWDLENHYTRHNKTERDEANAKIGKQFNKAIEATNSEVLTYEKLVSKLLQEKNITVSGSADTDIQPAEEERVLSEVNDQLINTRSVLENVNQVGAKCRREVSADKELSGKRIAIKSKGKCSNEGASLLYENDVEKAEMNSNEMKGEHSIEENTDDKPALCETDHDNMAVKFVNDTSRTVNAEEGTDVNDEGGSGSGISNEIGFGNGVKSEPEIGIDINYDTKTDLIESGLYPKLENEENVS
ncbi:myoneurin-like [Mercenaria mercenaria]|uniref:myoneurin-like n=1 Tax=Mercenaria mercenaria TaxID=6596 RepID=UPI00234ECC87|nr:myoneurin-like [Mercenaria mercenaria]